MTESWSDIFSTIYKRCGGRCCFEAHPPLTKERISLLRKRMDIDYYIEFHEYSRFRTRNDGYYIILKQSRCSINGLKPETCMAGPFTFDIRDGIVEIYLKKPSICLLVTFFKIDIASYKIQFETAQRQILHLVRSLPSDALKLICSIDESETEKIAEIPLYG